MHDREELANALERVQAVSSRHAIVASADITRKDRELLVQTEWLREIIRGWYLLARPDVPSGESTVWYAHFWDFLSLYLPKRYGQDYCLSADVSIAVHIHETTIPEQVIVIVKKGGGQRLALPFGTAIYPYADPSKLPKERENVRGLLVMPLSLALCRVGPAFFRNSPTEAQIALNMIRSPLELTPTIVRHNLKAAASRLVGAFEAIEKPQFAQQMREELTGLGIVVKPVNPFTTPTLVLPSRPHSPYVARLFSIWKQGRSTILQEFPPPQKILNPDAYLKEVQARYTTDAYNSLSIEGYRVPTKLIEQVRNHEWNSESSTRDAAQHDALAARGYHEAFQSVLTCVQAVLNGANSGQVFRRHLQDWYRALWHPNLQAGLLTREELAGYRNQAVFIRNSRHVPPPREALMDCMETLFECLETEPEASVRAVLGHYLFVFIHPYRDGNGRLGRFLMNLMLASGGYPWTIVEVARRDEYFNALEYAHKGFDLKPFARFIASEMDHNRS